MSSNFKLVFTAFLLVTQHESNSVEKSRFVFLGWDIERNTPVIFKLFYKIAPFKNVYPNRLSPIKNDYFCLKAFVPKYMQKAFLQKYGTHKEKQRQFIKIQLVD